MLNQEIYSRLGRGGEFSEPELWYLLLTVILAKKEAEEGGGELGDVRPRNILLNEQGCLKIPTLHSWPMEINKYQKMIGNTPTYVPPEELIELQSGCIEASSLA